MKKNFVPYIISGAIYFIALFSAFPLLGNENRVDWFGTSIYQIILLIGWAIFFVVFLLIGLILNKSKLKTPWKKILKTFKISFLGTFIIVGFGCISYTIDFNNWQKKSTEKREKYELEKELLFKVTVDSLQNVINSDSSNSNAFFKLGLAYRHEGQWIESVKNYKKAIKIDSIVSEYHSEMAYSESILKNWNNATKHYKIAYSLDSTKKWILSDIDRCIKMKEKSR
jgi:tetratricopeptide (TPR) repeat protein